MSDVCNGPVLQSLVTYMYIFLCDVFTAHCILRFCCLLIFSTNWPIWLLLNEHTLHAVDMCIGHRSGCVITVAIYEVLFDQLQKLVRR